ncbi:elongation factor Ts [Buchnera aphidicola (Muscaphis stroyani)]|uniref:Elongation factor Ts n=1 Tax=Buchnera aphidicola (Muscaphis stroyani) TaxID=1241869 RepID=A0A4D6Y3V8_9GAMM|nr:translation elongation factor Ts [Buchnera aphidicola]QCI24316.1 elongation factor Ts [Buchnera aphidicola (Muscaphis stroyani)]
MIIAVKSDLIKELRFRTGAGFMECKRALIEENGDIESAIDNLRKSGKEFAEKKINNVANQGSIFLKIINNIGVMIELNCETDFVAKDESFISLGQEIISEALTKKIKKFNDLKEIFEKKRIELISKCGENIIINRFHFMEGDYISSYLHGCRIGVLVNANRFDKSLLKNISMHIAASKPRYLHPENVCHSIFNREYEIQKELIKKFKKPSHISKKIIEGRMNKFVNEISLSSQKYIIDSSKTIGELLEEHNISIISFKRFEIRKKTSS